jgi:hypothetical protein
MPPYDIIRALIAAFTSAVNANKVDPGTLTEAKKAQADLQAKLDASNASLAKDDEAIAAFGKPLSPDETFHLNSVLATIQAAPAVSVPPPPAPPVDVPPVDQKAAPPVDVVATPTAPPAA